MILNKNSLENKYRVIAALAIIFLLAALVVAASFWSFSQSKVAAQSQKSTYNLIMHMDGLLSALKDAETGQRGYLLVGDESFLEPYLAVVDKIDSHINELHHFTFVNAAQKHLDILSPLVKAKMTLIAHTIELRRRQDMTGLLAIVDSGQGKQLMDSIRAEISNINLLEQDELAQQSAAFQLNMRYMLYTIVCASLLMIVFSIAIGIAGYNYLKNVQGDALSRLQKISSQLPGMVFQFCLRADGSSYFPFVSEAIRNIFRLSPEEVHEDASKVFAIVHPDDYDKIIASIKNAEHDLNPWSYEYRVKFDDGTVRWLSGNALLQRKEDGSTLWHGYITDITETKHRQQQDKDHLDQLAHVTRLGLLGEMASGIAHEVNQPLAAITTYAQVILNLIKKENPDLIKLAEVVVKTQQQALRAGSIIHRMKNFGKSFSKQHAIANINTLINDAIELCIVDLKQNGVTLDLKLTSSLPPVFVDPIQIEQVIINLIRNSTDALKSCAKEQQHQITIQSTMTLKNEILVRVKDNGNGINAEQNLKILMPFYTTKTEGMGMGLSISRSLIEAHKGTFNFNSEPGKGATFYFTIPTIKKWVGE